MKLSKKVYKYFYLLSFSISTALLEGSLTYTDEVPSLWSFNSPYLCASSFTKAIWGGCELGSTKASEIFSYFRSAHVSSWYETSQLEFFLIYHENKTSVVFFI